MTVPGSTSGSSVTPGKTPQESTRDGQTALYRFFDSSDALLYIGITVRLRTRFREHARANATSWWPQVSYHTVSWFPTKAEAKSAERDAIRKERPTHNVVHSTRQIAKGRRRVGKEQPTSTFGDSLLPALRRHFENSPFTAADVKHVTDLSRSGADKLMRALAERRDVIIVGTRHEVTADGRRWDSALYLLPIHQWISSESGNPLPPEQIPTSRPPIRRQPVPRPRKSRTETPRSIPQDVDLPPMVTFTTGAELLVKVGLVDSITREGVRFISRSPDWPFGPGKQHQYGKAGSAQTMDTFVFLEYFSSGPRRGGAKRRNLSVPPEIRNVPSSAPHDHCYSGSVR